jgi:hypothetical protein
MNVFSFQLEIFRRLIAAFVAFHTSIQPPPLLASKQAQRLVKRSLNTIMNVFSFQLEIFRRLNAVFTAFHTSNTTHTTFRFQTSPAPRKTVPFVAFDHNFFPVGGISTFKRCFCCISHEYTTPTTFSFETGSAARKTPPYVDNDRIFFPVGDISTYKRCFYCISHEQHNAHHF